MGTKPNFYETLQVPQVASQAVIAQAYRNLARLHHPDRSSNKALSTEKMVAINIAYSVLRYPDRRAEYDERLARLDASNDPQSQIVYSAGTGLHSTTNVASTPQSSHANSASATRPQYTASQPESPSSEARGREEDELIGRAEAALHHGQYSIVLEMCKKFLTRNPNSRRALEMLGDANAYANDIDAASAAYLSALHLAPKDLQLRIKLERLKASPNRHGHAQVNRTSDVPKKGAVQPTNKPKPRRKQGSMAGMLDAIKSWFR